MRGFDSLLPVIVMVAAQLVGVPRSSPAGSKPPATPRCVVISSVSIEDWVRDPVLAGEPSDSLFGRVISQPEFRYARPSSHFGDYDCASLLSPLGCPAHAATCDTVTVRVSLELEQAIFEQSREKVDLGAILMFGLLGFAFSNPDALEIAALVEWRMTVRTEQLTQPLVAVRYGACSGRLDVLGRREALIKANQRALWALGSDLMVMLNKELKLGLKPKRCGDFSIREYQKSADRFWEEGR